MWQYKQNMLMEFKAVQQLGREPTVDEIATKMEMPSDKLRKVLKIVKERIRSVSRVSTLTALGVMISSQEELRHGYEAEGVGATGSAVAS